MEVKVGQVRALGQDFEKLMLEMTECRGIGYPGNKKEWAEWAARGEPKNQISKFRAVCGGVCKATLRTERTMHGKGGSRETQKSNFQKLQPFARAARSCGGGRVMAKSGRMMGKEPEKHGLCNAIHLPWQTEIHSA